LTARLFHLALAFASGGLLAVILLFNGSLSGATNPSFSSLVPHATGTLFALAILLFWPPVRRAGLVWRGGAPLWAFLGGVSGAVTVIATSVAMNSVLALSGTLALGLVGQGVFALLADRYGLLGLPKRRTGWRGVAALVLILSGSGFVIAGGAA
jgi:bacterial/archaeal transporter family-2 protein